MTDEADRSQQDSDEFESRSIKLVQSRVKLIKVGEPGDCDYCGEYFTRLVGGACGHCRDRYKLP